MASDQTERAAEVIDTYLAGTSLWTQGLTIAEALDDERLLAAPVDGDLREALAETLAEYRRHQAEERDEGYVPGEYDRWLSQADREIVQLLPIIAAHVAEREPAAKEQGWDEGHETDEHGRGNCECPNPYRQDGD